MSGSAISGALLQYAVVVDWRRFEMHSGALPVAAFGAAHYHQHNDLHFYFVTINFNQRTERLVLSLIVSCTSYPARYNPTKVQYI